MKFGHINTFILKTFDHIKYNMENLIICLFHTILTKGKEVQSFVAFIQYKGHNYLYMWRFFLDAFSLGLKENIRICQLSYAHSLDLTWW